jgi:hypothetical protein
VVRGALLQQGSLLLGDGHLRLADYLPMGAGRREGVRAALAGAAAHAGAHLPAGVALTDLAEAVARELPGVRCVWGEAGPAAGEDRERA